MGLYDALFTQRRELLFQNNAPTIVERVDVVSALLRSRLSNEDGDHFFALVECAGGAVSAGRAWFKLVCTLANESQFRSNAANSGASI